MQNSVIASKTFYQHFSIALFHDRKAQTKDICKETEIMWIKDDRNQNNESWLMWNSQISPAAAAAAKSLQSCPTLCDPIDSSPPGNPVPGIL